VTKVKSPTRRWPRELSAVAAFAVAAAEFLIGHFWARNFIPQLGLSALAIAVLCVLSRIYVASVAWFAAAAFLLAPVLPAYLPRSAAVQPGCTLTIVNFNKEEDPPDDAGALRLLAGLHPDIAFIEKAYEPRQFGAALLADGFAGYSVFAAFGSTLILSRFPMIRTEAGSDGASADIRIEGRTVRLFNMYITRPNQDERRYRAGYRALRQRLARERKPAIIAGDGNATVFTNEVSRLRTLVHDAWDEKGFGLGATFPGPWRRMGILGPWMRIDYIFHNDAFDTAAVRRIDDAAGAGHYPVWARLVLVGAGRPGEPCAEARPHSQS
jgi:vancomycin resistance protein VanJ